MKILFIYTYEYLEPLGIMQLSSFLKQNNHSCYFIDLKLERDYMREIKNISPDIIAYSITTGRHRFYQRFNKNLKKEIKFFAIFGGPHCTFFPDFIEEEGVDAICRGEGEFAFLELANNLEEGRDITRIENVWVKSSGKVYKNEVRDLIDDLDILPFPDRELVNKYNHYKKMHMRFVLSGRGCPYRCTYCFNHVYNRLYKDKGRVIRKRSVENVIAELKAIKNKYKPTKLHFMDDTFNLDHQWLLKFCEAYAKEIHMPLYAMLRLNLVREDVVKALRDAGLVVAVSSIESGNDHMRNSILKRDMSEKQIIEANDLFNKYGFRILLQNIVGLPDETLEMAFETLRLNIRCRPSYGWVSVFQPYPMTELCEYARGKGYYDGDIEVSEASIFKRSILKMKDIKKIERLHHLFSLGVAFPLLVPLIRLLVHLPLTKFYSLLWKIHRTWCYFFRIKFVDLSEAFIRE